MQAVYSSNPLSIDSLSTRLLLLFFPLSLVSPCVTSTYLCNRKDNIHHISSVDEFVWIRPPTTTQLLHISTRKKKGKRRGSTTKPLNSIDLQTFSSFFFFFFFHLFNRNRQNFVMRRLETSTRLLHVFLGWRRRNCGNYSDAKRGMRNCRNNIFPSAQIGNERGNGGDGPALAGLALVSVVSSTDSITVAH